MKKFFLLLLLGFFVESILAQSYYREGIYTDGYDLNAGDITFKVSSSGLGLILENVENEWSHKPIMWLDGKWLSEPEYEALAEGQLDISSVKKAFRETFTEDEYKALVAGKDYMSLYMTMSTEGQVIDVTFFITISPRMVAVAPEKYALLENNLKRYVRYAVTEDEKKLKFFRLDIPIAFQSLHLRYSDFDRGPIIDAEQIEE